MTDDPRWPRAWPARQGDGAWERHWGIERISLDHPGWRVRIHPQADAPRERPFAPRGVATSGLDWLECHVYDRIFEGAGGPDKHAVIPRVFRDWCMTSP